MTRVPMPCFLEVRLQLIAPLTENIDEPGRGVFQVLLEKFDGFNSVECLLVMEQDLFLAFDTPIELLHLLDAHARLQIGEFEIVADTIRDVGSTRSAAEILEPS